MTTTNSCGAIPAQPTAYRLHFEATYNPAKSGPPRFACLVLPENSLGRKPVQIPATGAGPFLVRIQGTYPARDGEIFECVDPMHAEVFVVFRGFQFAIWWCKPEEIPEHESLFAGFLAGSRIFRRRVVNVLAKELALIGQYRPVNTARAAALRELLERTKKGKRAATIC